MSRRLKASLTASAALVLLVPTLLAVVGARQEPITAWPSDAPGRRVLLGDLPIRYQQSGSGPDVLLVHGSPGSIEDWAPIVERLRSRFRVTAFDRPGHGYSGGADLDHTPQENARIALDLVRRLELRRVVLVGHSYGGTTGLALALRDPDLLRSLVVVGASAYGPISVGPLYRLLGLRFVGAGISAAIGPWIGPGQIEAGIRASFGPNIDRIPGGFVAERIAIWNHPTVTTTLSLERLSLDGALATLSPHYREIRTPVFLVYGEQDRNASQGRRLAEEIPGARLVSLPDTGHYVQFARPDALVRVIDEAAATP